MVNNYMTITESNKVDLPTTFSGLSQFICDSSHIL